MQLRKSGNYIGPCNTDINNGVRRLAHRSSAPTPARRVSIAQMASLASPFLLRSGRRRPCAGMRVLERTCGIEHCQDRVTQCLNSTDLGLLLRAPKRLVVTLTAPTDGGPPVGDEEVARVGGSVDPRQSASHPQFAGAFRGLRLHAWRPQRRASLGLQASRVLRFRSSQRNYGMIEAEGPVSRIFEAPRYGRSASA